MRYAPAIVCAIAIAGCATATAAQPAGGVATASAPTVPAKPGSARVVCEEEDTLGSRLGGHRVCHTKAEWEQIRRDQGDQLDRQERTQRVPGG